MNRRYFMTTLGGIGLVSIAGCTTNTDEAETNGDRENNSLPTRTPDGSVETMPALQVNGISSTLPDFIQFSVEIISSDFAQGPPVVEISIQNNSDSAVTISPSRQAQYLGATAVEFSSFGLYPSTFYTQEMYNRNNSVWITDEIYVQTQEIRFQEIEPNSSLTQQLTLLYQTQAEDSNPTSYPNTLDFSTQFSVTSTNTEETAQTEFSLQFGGAFSDT